MGEKRTRRKSRSKYEILAELLTVLRDGPLNRMQISRAANLKGDYLKTWTDEWVASGILEWVGEATRDFGDDRNYGRKLQASRKGEVWLVHWEFILKLLKPTVKLKEP